MRPGEHSSGLPELAVGSLLAGAKPAATAVELKGQPVAELVEPVVQAQGPAAGVADIAAAGRSGIEEVYGVPYLDVGCDVFFHVARFTTSPH
jgi:hypothetical protein